MRAIIKIVSDEHICCDYKNGFGSCSSRIFVISTWPSQQH